MSRGRVPGMVTVTMPRHLQHRGLTWDLAVRGLMRLALTGLWVTALVMLVR
jgi:hypothetical protein